MDARLSYCDKKEKAAELHFLRENNLSRGETCEIACLYQTAESCKIQKCCESTSFSGL
ncbi:hypothetical protein PAJ34TS1_03830 [Paenibacillus azoreducens]|uniref:Uncharacterized protein n=1 Tax=Paenibacillus azoreducens TaxID=116718 RepID=A0A919YBA3_9BACL|nr:hypothetical protein J34TS1_23490 [Paenibacillus azoreducens]